MIEVATVLVIAHKLKCPDVMLFSNRTGRNLPVEGIEDLVGPTTLFLPVRTHVDPSQRIQDLLDEAQHQQSAMVPHEHLGWLELREMEEIKDNKHHALTINIDPIGLASLGQGLGLEMKSNYLTYDDPFSINVKLAVGKIKWCVEFEERFIDAERLAPRSKAPIPLPCWS